KISTTIVNDSNTTNIGELTILPSSYAGNPRHMHEYAQDDCIGSPIRASRPIHYSVRCLMYSVGWQKSGLPHAHVLIWLYHKITSNEIDNVICAKIPNADVDKDLHEVMRINMIHGTCGTLNPKLLRIIDGKCSKQYPRALISTQLQETRRSAEDGDKITAIHM
ncbi:unnamed protein product, partial [Onchocerca ochengi]